ncbi:hypothetical protein RvY_14120 [Ramazzottius varieornatus]|uniref:G-protein coupled receptors family 1 profile domain-containing protein n=1 Tax=Ramazzottius varieornatus TaxID=947166 RepID=A0A1D1VQ87_RAMVA|nr:hypothetical protein RvY_14120 [Ramazzottius varieornatus]
MSTSNESSDPRDPSLSKAWLPTLRNATVFTPSLTVVWSVMPVVAIFALIFGAIFNVTVLVTFLKHRHLRNSFGIYLMNLLIIDIILVFIHGPINIMDKYGSSWTLGWKLCAFQSYMGYTYQNLIIIAHFLIALNRVWAVVFPFSYRTHHTKKVAIGLCFSVWLALNICNVPVALTVTVLTPGSTNGTVVCDIDTETLGAWNYISQLFMFDTPILCVILAYPVVCYKSFFSDRKTRTRRTAVSQSQPVTLHRTMQNGYDDNENGKTVGGSVKPAPKVLVCGRILNGSATGFLTLTLMTASVIICLMPKEAYYTTLLFTDNAPPGFNVIADVLERLTTVCDPMLVVLGNSELRKIVFTWVHHRFK